MSEPENNASSHESTAASPRPSRPPHIERPIRYAPAVLVPWKPRIDDPRVLSKQNGAEVRIFDEGVLLKRGTRVSRNEEAALRLAKQHTTIPVPRVHHSKYAMLDGHEYGRIWMDHLEGSPLDRVWGDLDPAVKERLCHEIWSFVEQLRKVPKPAELEHFYVCGADGSVSRDVLLRDLTNPPSPLLDDESLRSRINERYLYFNGGSYREHLPDYLPLSDCSVFTHNDIAPRNILVNESHTITGLIDWEFAGWYPDYWEYAKTQVQWGQKDWLRWMDRTRPHDWDIVGIHKAKRVLF
ncbi:hypothetical protein CHU98_g6020 [Xylaria longipes]|nr:hypothetical protein CHU98_g6020 [Xylaria longipes]